MSKPVTSCSQPDKALNHVLERLRGERGLSREMQELGRLVEAEEEES